MVCYLSPRFQGVLSIALYVCIVLYTQPYFPISKNPMAMLSMSASTTRALLCFWLSFSMSRRHSFNISRIVWYCLEDGPKVFRAFSRLFDIYPSCYFLHLMVVLGGIPCANFRYSPRYFDLFRPCDIIQELGNMSVTLKIGA